MTTTPDDDAGSLESPKADAPAPTAASAGSNPDYTPGVRARHIAITSVVIYLLFDLLLPLIRVPPHHSRTVAEALSRMFALVLVPTGIFMLLQVWLSRSLVGLGWPVKVAGGIVAASTVLWFITLNFLHPAHHLGAVINSVIIVGRTALLGLFLTVGLTALGTLLARIIREPNVLLPVALIAMPIDYVGAMTNVGFTNTVVKHAPNVVQAVSVPVPHMGGLHTLALIGPGDALFMAFFFAVVLRLDMNMRGTFWWMTVLLAIAMFIVLLTPFPVAALVPMGISVVIANWRHFHLKREEVFAVIYAALIVFAIVGVFYFVAHRVMTR
jgi:hypothetical protein